ncbi:MAG: zf-HC2 domain-containing protein [Syntrophomonadaceae bacterium]|jgi:hypothetical protein
MNCDKVKELLSPYIDEMTNEKETNQIRAHLKTCSHCRNELEQMNLVCKMVRELPALTVPDKFTQDLANRLASENIKYFGRKTLKTPKQAGWLAAGVASIALAVGIYASSFLPAGELIANIKEYFNARKNNPRVAIEDILKHTKIPPNNETVNHQPEETGKSNLTEEPSSVVKHRINNPSSASVPVTIENQQEQELDAEQQLAPQSTEMVTSRIMVNDIDSSVQKVIKIAASNEGQYEVLPVENTAPQTLSRSQVKGVSIKVDEGRSDQVLNELNSVGKIENSVSNNVELIQQYNEAVNNIKSIKQQINDLKSPANSAINPARLNELQTQLNEWRAKKAGLEAQLNKTTINVYLMEDVQP